jgi:hypothetical protein
MHATIASPATTYERELPNFDRVRKVTPDHVNRKIDARAQKNVNRYRGVPREKIQARLWELEREWDIDRALMASFAVLGGATFAAGMRVDRKWFGLLSLQLGFLFYHAAKGWCPPVSVLRRLGFRTVREIDAEKVALEALLRLRSRMLY